MKFEKVISGKAIKNVEKWGLQDYETLGLAIAEETGELAQAILQYMWEGGSKKRILEEAADLGALCIQVSMFYNSKTSE